MKRSSWIIRMALNPVTNVLVRDTNGNRHIGKGHLKMEAEIGVPHHRPRDAWNPRSWKMRAGPSPGASKRNLALGHLDLILLAPEL